MNDENINALRNLSKTCYVGGFLPIFLGGLVTFVGVINSNMQTVSVGLFIFIVGYAFIKISTKIKKNIEG